MRRLLPALLALVALLVALASWWASRTSDGADRARAASAPAGSPAAARAAVGAADTAAGADAANPRAAADASSASGALAAQRSTPERRTSRRIRVVDAATGAPLPSASAWWMGLAEHHRWLESDFVARGLDVEAAWRAHGAALALDEQAETELPPELVDGVRVAALEARGADAAAFDAQLFARERTDLLVLALVPQRRVDVYVIDAAGAPVAGVPVGIADLAWSDAEALIVRTDAGGRARFTGITHWLRRAAQPAMLGLVAPLDPVPFVRELPEQPVTLRLAAHGRLRVHARADLAAGALAPDARPNLSAAPAKDVSTGVLPAGLRVVDWEGELGPLQAGVPLVLAAELAHWQSRQLRLEPLAPGEVRDVEVVFGAPQPLVVARVLGPDGAPRANARFELRLADRSGMSTGGAAAPLATDGAGRLALTDAELNGDDAWTFVLATPDGRESTSAPIPHPLGGYRDLGDLVLRAAPLIAAGMVVDALGAPVEDAELAVWIESRVPGWPAETQIRARSDASGRFELRGELAAEPASITALSERRRARLSRADGLRRGATGLTLVLDEPCRLYGRVELPEGWPREFLHVRIAPASGRAEPVELAIGPDGSFQTELAPAGVARLEVRADPCGEVLAALDRLVLPPRGQADDPRLNPVRLGPAQELVRIRVVDRERRPRSGFVLATGVGNGRGGAWMRVFRRGELVLPRICRTTQFVVTSAGCGETPIDLAHAPAELVLGSDVAIELDVQADGLPADATLSIEATRDGSYPAALISAPNELATLYLPAAGRWNLRCSVRVSSGSIALREDLPCAPASIEVGPDQPQRQVLRVDTAAAQALRAVQRR